MTIFHEQACSKTIEIALVAPAAAFGMTNQGQHPRMAVMPNASRRVSRAGRIALLFCFAANGGSGALAAQPSPESAFLQVPSAAGARASSTIINRQAHYPGTAGDYRLAVYMRDAMRGFGLRAWIESLSATVYTPRVLQLQLLASPVVNFNLRDQAIAADPDGSRPDAGLPFNAGSGNGDVRAPLVYASRGLDADYATLAGAGVSVAGRIVLVRYGAEYRGNLAARAAQHGAAGVIFYSDPKGDGFARGAVYPNGRYRPLGAVQRGDVMGDDHVPLRIPTLPVTALTAQRLLADVGGVAGPAGWAGALAVPYRVGTSRSRVRLHVEMNARQTTLWNTLGEIAGSDPQQMVVLGGHRDAWVYGVTDDGSGISTLLEVARGLGALHRAGWTPKRSIRIAGWDAEEIGELGSEAYVAAHRSELQRGCIAYLNTDEAASGPTLGAAAAAAIAPALQTDIHDVLHANVQIDGPAGGSDFESFIYTIGTPVIDLGYSGAFGTYHSPYDDLRYAALYADPGFVHHRAVAQAIGVFAMRLADAGAATFTFEPYASVLDSGAKTMTQLASNRSLTLDSALGAAITKFQTAAHAYDSSQAPHDAAKALAAAQQLDTIAYSANGYASVAFPRIAAAIASGTQSDVDTAVTSTAAALNSVTALLGE
jgi:N-acetylated-alpha-linked acidic dipeptidase